MQWWCSAQTAAWDWTWRAYPGVWLFVLALAAAWAWLARPTEIAADEREDPRAWRHAAGVAGLLLIWAALDWPIGALGAGYLASVHSVQFILLGVVAPPLLLLGLSHAAWRRALRRPRLHAVVRWLTQPVRALGLYFAIVLATHLPAVVDPWLATQLGNFGIDALWLLAGVLFWWPVVVPVPGHRFFQTPVKIGYLIAATMLNVAPGALLTFAELPPYAVYELAPPATGLSPIEDQRLAGILMNVVGGALYWVAIAILFYRWATREGGEEERARARTRGAGAAST